MSKSPGTKNSARGAGRGTLSNPPNRFEEVAFEPDSDESVSESDEDSRLSSYFVDTTRKIITFNKSEDLPFDASINPYRGCEHGCIYCYARPYHEYLGFSGGLDFESKIIVKPDAPKLLRDELSSPKWKPQVIAMSGVTDIYQPVERKFQITRSCLEVLAEFRNPVAMITKNALITRDLDILTRLSVHSAVSVLFSITTLDESLRRRMEPRTSTAEKRFGALEKLNAAGIPAGVMIGPVIPGLNDKEIPAILGRAADAGATFAAYTVLRLPYGVGALFESWLEKYFPYHKDKVMRRVREVHNDRPWEMRMQGGGEIAKQIAFTFKTGLKLAGIPNTRAKLSTASFRRRGQQGELFT